MAFSVNNLGTVEFIPTDNAPVDEMKDDVIPAADSISNEVVKDKDSYLKEEVDLDWDQNDIEMNDLASTNNSSNIDNVPLENMPIIILPAGKMKAVKGIAKKKIIYMCKICRKIFDTTDNLKEHGLTCKLIGCQLCDFTTMDRSAFKIHWEHHQELEQASKKVLEKMEMALKKAKPKLVNMPNSENEINAKNYDCPNCSKKYKTVEQLKVHLYRCDQLQCKLCDFKTYKSYDLRRHFQISHQTPEELIMSCPKCKKVLKNPHSFSTHKWICGKIPRCECHDCGYKTFTKYNLRTHILAKHLQPSITKEDLIKKNVQLEKGGPTAKVNNGDPYARKVCNLCKKSYHNQRALSAHSIHCKLYECNQCHFETFRKAYLRKHIRLRHKSKEGPLSRQDATTPLVPMSADPIIQYDVPELSSSIEQDNTSSLEPALDSPVVDKQQEMDSSFADTEQMCTICYEIFQNGAALRDHSLNCREYQCNHCPYRTYIPADLDNHVNQKHDIPKQIDNASAVCPKCNKHYKNDNVVISHLRYCGKESTKCDYCPFKSKRPGILKAHVKISHPLMAEREKNEEDKEVKKEEEEEEVSQIEEEKEVRKIEEEVRKIEEEEEIIKQEDVDDIIREDEMEFMKEEEEEIIICDKCGQKLKDNETVAFHSFYCPRKPFLDCNMCSFKTRYGLCLKNHILRVHCQNNHELEFYECPKCSGRLTTQETFKKHVVSCLPQSALRCSLCTYMTRDPTCLSDHVLDKHYKDDPTDTSDIKLIPCPKCGNKLKNPQSLRSHLMHCEKEAHFQCPHCPHKAKMKCLLDRHMLSRHKTKR